MQVKVFTTSVRRKAGFLPLSDTVSSNGVEGEINLWLAANPDIKIVNITQSQSGGSWLPATLIVSVWYE